MSKILEHLELGFPWTCVDPFLFTVHHLDLYPEGHEHQGPAPDLLAGRPLGTDFTYQDHVLVSDPRGHLYFVGELPGGAEHRIHKTARFAEVRDMMNATVDEAELTSLINEAEQLLADNVVIIPLCARLDPGPVWADEIGGYKHNPSQAGSERNIEERYRVDL